MREPVGLELAALSSLANLAALNLDAAAKLVAAADVRGGDFASPELAAVWEAMALLLREGRLPDLFAVEALTAKRTQRQTLVRALMAGADAAPAAGAAERVRQLEDAGRRKRLLSSLRAVAEVVKDTARPLEHAVAEAQRALETVQAKAGSASAEGDLLTLVDLLEQVSSGKREPVLQTGFGSLDAVIGGLQRTLTVVGALPGVGKSALLAALVESLALRGRRVGVLSLEDERSWLTHRLVSARAGVPLFVLRNKPLGHHQRERVGAAVEALYEPLSRVVIDDRPGMTTDDVLASARDMVLHHRCEALLVDHLGEIRFKRSDRHDLDTSEALRDLRALAKTFGVPVVVLCHLRRREGLDTGAEPRLTDFANSSGVERMARVALALTRPEPDVLRVHVLKQTNGAAGVSVDLQFVEGAALVKDGEGARVSAKAEAMYAQTEREMSSE